MGSPNQQKRQDLPSAPGNYYPASSHYDSIYPSYYDATYPQPSAELGWSSNTSGRADHSSASESYYQDPSFLEPAVEGRSTPSVAGSASSPKELNSYACLYDDCDYTTRRLYDLDRHYKAKHTTAQKPLEPGKMYDCPDTRCAARGKNGFKRKDHLRDHVRRLHRHELGPDNSTLGVQSKPKSREEV